MRPMGNYEYVLRDREGWFINAVKSPVVIQAGDELSYKGNKLTVVRKDSDSSLTVEKTGSIITVE